MREWARDAPLAVGLALLVAVLVAIGAGGGGALDRLGGEALRERFERVQRAAPGIVHSARFDPEDPRAGSADEDFGDVLGRYGTAVENASPKSLDGGLVHDSTRIVLPTVRGGIAAAGTVDLSLVYASDAPRPAGYVAGRVPRGRGNAVELAVSTRTRDALGLRVGQRFRLGDGALKNVDVEARVVGVFRADGERRLWKERPLLVRPLRARGAANAGALIAPRGVEVLQRQAGVELTVDWNMRLAPGGETADRFVGEEGRREFQRIMARYPPSARRAFCGAEGAYGGKVCVLGNHPATELETATALPDTMEEFSRRWDQARVVISFAWASLLAVGFAALVVTSLSVVRRALAGDRLRRARGASAGGVAARRALWSAPAVLAGFGGGCALAGAVTAVSPSYQGGLAVALLCSAPLPLLTWAALRDGALLRGRARSAGRRLVGEAVVLLLAVGGVFALRARGTEGSAGPDPLVAAVPALLGVATVVLLVRCYPWPVRAAARWSAAGRGVVPLVALSRAAREAPARGLALLVLVVTLAGAVFGGLVSGTLLEGRRAAAAWQVGADASFLGAGRDPAMAERLARARGVRETVAVRQLRVDPLSGADGGRYGVSSLVGVDAGALRDAGAGSAAARALADAGLDGGGEGGDIRVLASDGRAGELLTFTRHGKEQRIRIVGALPGDVARDPALGPVRGATGARQHLLLADSGDLEGFAASDFEETALLLFGDRLDTAQLRSLVPRAAPGAATGELRVLAEERAEAAEDGLVAAVAAAHTGCTALAVVLALLALVIDLSLSAPSRGRVASYLRTLGLGGRAASALHLLQLLPLVCAAVVGGVALGLALPSLLGPVVDLREFTGGPVVPERHVDVFFVAALGAGICALVAAAVAVESRIGRRRRLGAVLRLGRSDD
ncbi:hypothetical protein [Streptomyces sp. A1499]|uniref:hypothetical protein n=1 Tax=Streptomyces sp. A1499 TaxID=2563104 RepID=UPI00109EC1BA|nr:hypothetical protein [Streptomyces sp. A1499]THC45984.1 hypothetical protein E7X58_31005 [Streptomyces sp. A1499]